MAARAELLVVGGGIIGLAIAYRFTQRYPRQRVVVLEKEHQLAGHQSGHNSGVLHAGVYYRPGSLKALFSRTGKAAMEAFCQSEGIPFERCGKVIVAVGEDELDRLRAIAERGQQNGVDCTMIDRQQLAELEPHAAGVAALHVPETGVVDYRRVCHQLARRIEERGGSIRLGTRVAGVSTGVAAGLAMGSLTRVTTTSGTFEAPLFVNAAGLHVDRLARAAGASPPIQIVPFRGEYYRLTDPSLCRSLIYPVPDPELPFLGVHVSRRIDGTVECGPNAVLAFSREGYRASHVSARDLWGTLTYPGFLRMASRNLRTGAAEMWRSLNRRAFAREVQRLLPQARAELLVRSGSGVRAQAVARDGKLVDDFLIERSPGTVHVLNAPSPAATASLAVGDAVVDHLEAGAEALWRHHA